jgi:methionyl-tRNA formyltransferase
MNIVFFGSSQFAAPALKALIGSGHEISCVVTQPDSQKGRGLRLAETAVKKVAQEANLKIYQPQRINTAEALRLLKGLKPDLFVVVAYGQILSKGLLEIPKIFSINVHASLLPRYRGAAPINWAIINGERKSGITIIRMTEEMDAGAILLQRATDILGQDTAVTLAEKLSDLGANLLLDSLRLIRDNKINLILQNEAEASFAPKLKKEDGLICWNKAAREVHNQIRGCLNWPGAFTYYKGNLLKIYKATVKASGHQGIAVSAGEIVGVAKEGISVATGKDNLVIEELQMEGRRRMEAGEFIAGHKISAGERFYKK